MWIICAGAKRSGSTLQYNFLSQIVERTDAGKRVEHFKPEEFPSMKLKFKEYEGFLVIKTHTLTNYILEEIYGGNAIVVHSYRDIRDVVVSYINKGWIGHNEDQIKGCVNQYLKENEDWTNLNTMLYSRKYENFAFDIAREVLYFADILKLNLDEADVVSIVNELRIENLKEKQNKIAEKNIRQSSGNRFDQETLLHTNHINDGSINQYIDNLSENEIVLIESISYDYLLKHEYNLYWTQTKEFISFSQHADDYIAWQLLGKPNNAIVVEVGAFDGRHLSNSYSFEMLDWNTLCIEPNSEIFNYLKQHRPNAINLNYAVVGDEKIKEIDFFIEDIGVLSGCNLDEEDVRRRYENRGIEYKEAKKIKVPGKTLNQILNESIPNQNEIDLVSIDVEGFELEVLKGLDLKKFNVKLFIIEANTAKEFELIQKFFNSHKDYVFVGNNYQNLFFVRKELLNRGILKNLNFDNYQKAKQLHPKGNKYVIDSRAPKFEKSREAIKIEKLFGIF